MSKIYVISDTHHDSYDRYPGKLEEDLAVLRGLYADAVSDKALCVFHLGDLFERNDRIYSGIYSRVFSIMRSAQLSGVPTIILAGNHDMKVLNCSELNAIFPFGDGVYDGEVFALDGSSRVVWGPAICDLGGTEIMCIPYMKDVEDIFKAIRSYSIFKPCMLFGHFTAPDKGIAFDAFDLTVLGHEHAHRYICDNAMYLGSLYHHSFSDEGNGAPRYLVMTLPDKATESIRLHLMYNNLSRWFKTVEVTTEQEYADYLEKVKDGYFSSSYTRPSSTGFEGNYKEKKLLEDSVELNLLNLLGAYVQDNYKGALDKEGLKRVGESLVRRERCC